MASINNLSKLITQELKKYTDEVIEGINVEKKQIAKSAVQELKNKSPKMTGSYKKGWRVKDENGKQIIYNKTDYQLTHLLEFGHAKRNGGRVDAIPHIRPVEEKVISDFTAAVERVIRK